MRIKKGYKVRNIADENIVVCQGTLNMDFTKVIYLNKTSVELWNQFEGKEFMLEDVADFLCSKYGIDSERAVKDGQKWIDALSGCGIL
ncbi:MAG: PqqD family protein [Bacteroidaceae bacterium]|nr:PqqD family protein [Bacteroidaceae bacterium]